MIVFKELPLELSYLINDFLEGQLKYNKINKIMNDYLIGSLLSHTKWSEIEGSQVMKMSLSNAKTIEEINKYVLDGQGCFFIQSTMGVKHKSIECACESHQIPPKIVSQSFPLAVFSVANCPQCYK